MRRRRNRRGATPPECFGAFASGRGAAGAVPLSAVVGCACRWGAGVLSRFSGAAASSSVTPAGWGSRRDPRRAARCSARARARVTTVPPATSTEVCSAVPRPRRSLESVSALTTAPAGTVIWKFAEENACRAPPAAPKRTRGSPASRRRKPLEVGRFPGEGLSGLLDPHHQVVHRAGQHALDRRKQRVCLGAARRDRHHVLRHGEAAAGRGPSEPVMGDQLRDLGPLQLQAGGLCFAGRGPLALVPAHGLAHRHQQATPRVGPVAELGVLCAPLGEALVVGSHGLVEVPRDAQVASGHDPEDVVVVGS